MASIRIFSYLPNPRIWKATITGRLCGVDIEVRGAPAAEMPNWLWDFDARHLDEQGRAELSHLRRGGKTGFGTGLVKTDAFLRLNPLGTGPVAFDPTGSIGIFESNSIMRTVARLGRDQSGLYGRDPFSASRIDAFPDLEAAGLSPLLGAEADAAYPATARHFWSLVRQDAFSPDCLPYLAKLGVEAR